MSDYVVRHGKIHKQLPVAIAVDHLTAVPEGVVVFVSVVHRGDERLSVPVDGIPTETILIELGDTSRLVECILGGGIRGILWIWHWSTRQCLGVLAIGYSNRRCSSESELRSRKFQAVARSHAVCSAQLPPYGFKLIC